MDKNVDPKNVQWQAVSHNLNKSIQWCHLVLNSLNQQRIIFISQLIARVAAVHCSRSKGHRQFAMIFYYSVHPFTYHSAALFQLQKLLRASRHVSLACCLLRIVFRVSVVFFCFDSEVDDSVIRWSQFLARQIHKLPQTLITDSIKYKVSYRRK